MKTIKVIFYAVWLFIVAVLQPTLFSAISVFGISPNIFLAFVIITAGLKGKSEGAIIGAIFGFVYDLLIGQLIGFNALIYMYAGLLTGILKEKYISIDGVIMAAITTAVVDLICAIIYYFAYSLMHDIGFFFSLYRIIIPEAIYTGIVMLILFVPVSKSFNIIKSRSMMY